MISVHGGIGATWEHDAPLYFRRAQLSRRLLGGTAGATDRVAGELLAQAAGRLRSARRRGRRGRRLTAAVSRLVGRSRSCVPATLRAPAARFVAVASGWRCSASRALSTGAP